MSTADWVLVAGLGALGAFARFLVDGAVSLRSGRAFPFGTMVVNLSGAVVLGFITGLALSSTDSALFGGATVGSYTTFSTWMLETQRLGEDGSITSAYANIVVSLVLGIFAAWLGRLIGRHV